MGGNSPCASCKLLRRRCAKDCIFAPFFPSDDPHKFSIVHKVFGASNISKMLQELPVHQRADAVSSLVYEANARMRDPVYGCIGAISFLQNQVSQLQMQLAVAQAEILCIQMQQEPDHQINNDDQQTNIQQQFALDSEDGTDRSYLMQNGSQFASMPDLFTSFPTNSSSVSQEPLKREFLWT